MNIDDHAVLLLRQLSPLHTQLGVLIGKADPQETHMPAITHEDKTDLALAADGTIAKCMDGCRVCGMRAPAPVPARLQKALEARLTDIHARVAAAEARTTAATVLARAYAGDRLRELQVAKATTEYGNVPGTPADIGALLFELGQADSAGIGKSAAGGRLVQRFEAILKAADDALGRAPKATDPTAASAAAASSNAAYSQLLGNAQALQDKDPNLSEAQAISKAATLHPGLVRQWQRDNNAGGGNVRI